MIDENWKFQFHYGTIKSLCLCRRNKKNNKFQFHYGTIKSGWNINQYTRANYISIPLWYD